MADVVKAQNYKKEDLRFLLSRKYRNAGIAKTKIDVAAGTYIADIAKYGSFYYKALYNAGTFNELYKMASFTPSYTGYGMGNTTPARTNQHIVIDEGGYIYYTIVNSVISHAYQSAIDNETSTLDLIGSIGSAGAGDEQFNTPQGMCLDNREYFFVADTENDRIAKYKFGKYVGKKGIGAIVTIDVDETTGYFLAGKQTNFGDQGGVYRYDKDGSSIAGCDDFIKLDTPYNATNGFTSTGTSIYSLDWTTGGTGATLWKINNGGFLAEFTWGAVPVLAVAIAGTALVRIFDIATRSLLRQITSNGAVADIKYYDGYIYIGHTTFIEKYNLTTGEWTTIFTGSGLGRFAVIRGGGLYVVVNNNVVQKIKSDGTFCYQVTTAGTGDGETQNPTGVAINYAENRLYIAEKGNSRAQWLTWGKWVANYTLGATLDRPTDVVSDNDNNIFICDYENNRVVKVNSDFIQQGSALTLAEASKIAFNPDTENLYILPRNSYYVYIYDTDLNYISRMPITTIVSIAGYYGNIAYIDGNIIVMADDGTATYDSEFFIYINNFEKTPIDITRFVSFKSDMTLTFDSDAANFSIGKVIPGDCSVELLNDTGYFNPEYETSSIFYDTAGLYQRNLSRVDIELKGDIIFRGIIDGKNATQKENAVVLKLFSPLKYLDTIPMAYFQQFLTDDDTISEILPVLLDSAYTRDFFNYSATDISIFYDAVIDDVSALPDKLGDTLKLLSQLGLFSYGLYNGVDFYTYSYIAAMQARTLDLIITENSLLDIKSANKGEQRLFKTIRVKNDTTEKEYTIPLNVQDLYNEDRGVDIDTEAITTEATQQAIADNYEYISVFPAKEFEIELPLFIPADKKIYNKQFAFNIFDDNRGYAFNTPALTLGNKIIPTKETALDQLNSNARVLYYLLGYKIKIGKVFMIEIKLREEIDDDYTP